MENIPKSLTLEQAVLVGSWYDGWDEIRDILSESDFSTHRHQLIFRATKSLFDQNKPVDVLLVADWLKNNALINDAGGEDYLGWLLSNTLHDQKSNIRSYATRIREFAIERELLAVTESIKESILDKKGMSTLDILEGAESKIMAIANHKAGIGNDIELTETKELLDDVFNKMASAMDRKDGELSGVKTGIDEVDEYTDGFQKQDLIFIGARPSMGKTTLGMNFAEAALFNQNLPVVVFSMESPKYQIGQRLLSAHSKVPMGKIKSGVFEGSEFSRVQASIKELKARKLIIADKGGLSPSDMRSVLRKIEREHGGVGFILADYVQKMKLKGDHKKNRNEELTDISGDLKEIAKDYDCPFVVLAQLSKECERRPNKRPMMSDLRDCGGLEQDADVIIMVYRDEVYFPQKAETQGLAELIFCKNRNGKTGTVPTRFSGDTFRFSTIPEAHKSW